jgi:hypothetical protein
VRQGQARQVAGRDLDRVEPEHVVEQATARTDPRPHEPRQHIDGRAAARPRFGGAHGKRRELAMTAWTEERRKFRPAFSARKQSLDVLVVQPVQRKVRAPVHGP